MRNRQSIPRNSAYNPPAAEVSIVQHRLLELAIDASSAHEPAATAVAAAPSHLEATPMTVEPAPDEHVAPGAESSAPADDDVKMGDARDQDAQASMTASSSAATALVAVVQPRSVVDGAPSCGSSAPAALGAERNGPSRPV